MSDQSPPITDLVGQCCQNCGREVTDRNARYHRVFLGKPLCDRWRPCHRRATGNNAPRMYRARRHDRLIIGSGKTSIAGRKDAKEHPLPGRRQRAA